MRAQVGGRYESCPYAIESRDECSESLLAIAAFDISVLDEMILIHNKDKPRNASLTGSVVFQLGYGHLSACGDMAVPESEHSDVYIATINHLKRYVNRIRIGRRKFLHHQRKHVLAKACFPDLPPMIGKIDQSATHDNDPLLFWHVPAVC